MRVPVYILSILVVYLYDRTQGAISPAQPSSIYTSCLQRARTALRRQPSIRTRDEGLEWSCMQSYLWQTAAEREAPRNLTTLQVTFLQTLVGNPRLPTRAFQILRNPSGSAAGSRQTTTRPPRTGRPTTIRPGRRLPQFFPRVTSAPVTTRPPFTLRPNFRNGRNTFRRSKRSTHERLRRSLAGIPRKEYRAMSDAERNAFHAALNAAKNSLLLSPNVYDFVASLHSGVLANGAHGGPAFLPFHRIYILIMDLVICYFDDTNSIRLPFWDNTLDNELSNPALSIMWHSSFAGQGNGFVSNGPFGSWSTLHGPSIRRSIGSGFLMSKANVDTVLTRSHLAQISRPTAFLTPYDLEGFHGQVHEWVGGDMGSLNTATNDPVFFMHHAFIDCVWQEFRDLQPGKGVNPNTDYPNTFQLYNRPTDSIGIIPGITNQQAVSAVYASLSRCVHPKCPRCGPYLECVNRRCVPVLSDEADPCPSCPGNNQGSYTGYQNSYCINGYCDTSEWAYLPVQITYSRPPDYDTRGRYSSYPVVEGRSDQTYDIYSPRAYTRTGVYSRRYSRQDRSSRYTDCGCRQGGSSSGSVYVQSYGMNYDGNYREYAVVDRRYAISSNTAYVAVRNPNKGASRAYVNVYDDCGRPCRPTCWNAVTRNWGPCSGAITLTTAGGRRRGYGDTYEDATYQVWNYDNENYPTYSQDNIYLNYYCDYSSSYGQR